MDSFDQHRSPLKVMLVTATLLSAGLIAGKYAAGDSVASGASAGTNSLATESIMTESPAVSDTAATADASSGALGVETASASDRVMMSDAQFDRMTRDIRRSVGRFRGTAHIYIKNLSSGREWTYNADMRVPSASLIKLPVMVGVREKIAKGGLNPDQKLVLSSAVRRGGSGQLKWRKNGEWFSVSELLDEMIASSDNIAQEMLIREVGMGYLKERFASYGFKATNITREGLSIAPQTRIENYTTAREMGRLLDMVYSKQVFGEQVSDGILRNLRLAKSRDRLRKYMPSSWEIAHKTGLVRKSCHDVAIVSSPAGDYIVCVLTYGAPSYREAKQFIAKVGAITFRHYTNPAPSAPAAVVASTRPAPARSS